MVETAAAIESGGSPRILDAGCGKNKYPGSVGLDYREGTAADVIHDLAEFPYPFSDDEFDLVVSRHVIEHLPDVVGFVEEVVRVTKPGGRIEILTPHYTNADWAADPTHRNHLSSYTFNIFIEEKIVFDFYTDVRLQPLRIYVTMPNLWKALGIEFLINLDCRWPAFRFTRKFWEQYLSYIIRGQPDLLVHPQLIMSQITAGIRDKASICYCESEKPIGS